MVWTILNCNFMNCKCVVDVKSVEKKCCREKMTPSVPNLKDAFNVCRTNSLSIKFPFPVSQENSESPPPRKFNTQGAGPSFVGGRHWWGAGGTIIFLLRAMDPPQTFPENSRHLWRTMDEAGKTSTRGGGVCGVSFFQKRNKFRT